MANPAYWDGSLLKDPDASKKKQKNSSTRGRASGISQSREKPIRKVSEKKSVSDMVHDAYRDAFIFLARRYDDLRCWHCGIECKPSQLDLHHEERRSRGGKHKAFNYSLACNRKSANGVGNCHDRLDGNDVRWTGRETA